MDTPLKDGGLMALIGNVFLFQQDDEDDVDFILRCRQHATDCDEPLDEIKYFEYCDIRPVLEIDYR